MPSVFGRRRVRILLELLLLLQICTTVETSSIPPRWSCRHHFLAGLRASGVMPIRGHPDGTVSRVMCHMNDSKGISTEIHSALELPHFVQQKRSVNFQIEDLNHLRDLVSKSQCEQTLTVVWSTPPDLEKGSFTIVSLLNSSLVIDYEPEQPVQKVTLDGLMAGVRHILPNEDHYQLSPTISASSLVCRHDVLDACLVRGKVEVDLDVNSDWTYEFAFRTDQANQTLVAFHTSESTTLPIRLENDFFIRVDSAAPVPVGLLSDARWHTIVVHSVRGRVSFAVDNSAALLVAKNFRVKTLEIKTVGDVMLIDPSDVKDDCVVNFNQRRRLHETVASHSLCEECECPTLSHVFDRLPSGVCQPENEQAFSFYRDPERLSFLYVENGLEIDDNGAAIVAISATFKSDSDTGLVFFGFWHNELLKGRFQVFFHFDRLTAIYCQHNGQEHCMACSIQDRKGFGDEKWVRTAFFGAGDELHLVADGRICRLDPVGQVNNISSAEVYAVPAFAHGSGVFIGGTFYEKKRRGIYRSDVEHQFFENTREKAPSLRGCVKDVFIKGQKVDLLSVYEKQKGSMLVDASDSTSFAIRYGCPTCEPKCPKDVRCRARAPLRPAQLVCDCSDVQQFNSSEGVCSGIRDDEPVVLSPAFLTEPNIVLPVENTKAVVSKVWIKFQAPKSLINEVAIAEFNSHREPLFRILIDANGFLQVQVLPQDAEGSASRKLDLLDDRVHLLILQRRTPLGTRHNARKYDLFVDGWHQVVADIGKLPLNNISIVTNDGMDPSDELNSVIVHDFGLAYDYDEHSFLHHPSNQVHQVDVHSLLLPYQFRKPDLNKVGVLDPSLWERPIFVGDAVEDDAEEDWQPSPYGQVVAYTPDAYVPEQLLSARWLLYSMALTILLCLLILLCILCYSCFFRKKGRRRTGSGSDRVTIMRDSPDYQPVKLRRNSIAETISYDGDGSLGTDDTDLQAYRDIPSHRVKIYRESMVSILVPSSDQANDAAIVKRSSSVIVVQPETSEGSPQRPTPSSDSPAPLVNVNDD
ncbi:unnamed protein product [Caenorhabditis auriculariae]|uniref:BAM-2-like concanavalin A-like domain-containing protein n=1 Tax=Caenorhabditis auriculariae TaxID=2777116 RepID=A0A8S1HFV5_9PELO|nr:unnamed protein product [Caenorhabditis auriculariae]